MERAIRRYSDSAPLIREDTTFGFLDKSVGSSQVFHPKLISNHNFDTMLAAIKAELRRSQSFTFSVAFVTSQAIASLKQALLDFTGHGKIITSTYLGFNSPSAFRELLNLPGVSVHIVDPQASFHAKGYIFEQSDHFTAIVGSSNLTESALNLNNEWNLRFSALPDGDIVSQLSIAVDEQLKSSQLLTHQWIDNYELTYVPPYQRQVVIPDASELNEWFEHEAPIRANTMQTEALAAINEVREQGEKRAVVVSATGTGKTILAALDVQAAQPQRFLFIVHREQILDRAIEEFKRVLRAPAESFGKFVGSIRQQDRQYVFATIQSLSKAHHLESFDPKVFDYILIDEVHRAGAETYQRVINHFEPQFLLGFTATPERTDEVNLFELFDFNVPYEIRLQEALTRDMLAPFHYYGVSDYETAAGEIIDETSQLAHLVMPERVQHIVTTIETYGHAGEPVRGLIFCSRKEEAHQLSTALDKATVLGKQLRTLPLTGDDSIEFRELAVNRLEQGELDYLITVDIFNEGVDIPSVNQIIMLRQTQSSIIFTQQLGRGLRKTAGKDHLRVIDFIGNYKNNFLIPIALFGDNSLNKDSIRKHLLNAEETGVISGVSSVNFDRVSKQRVFESLAAIKLDSMVHLKKTFTDLEFRLGHPPMLFDFARFDAADPVVIGTKHHNYWQFLLKVKATDIQPSSTVDAALKFLTAELLPGKRPHELVILQALLKKPQLQIFELTEVLKQANCDTHGSVMDSVYRIFDHSFFTQPEREKYGNSATAVRLESQLVLSPQFASDYVADPQFKKHVDDIIETGIFLAQHKYGWAQSLTVGERYSRKDVCRLMNWKANEQGSIFGYKVDFTSNSCPIFITYHKDDDVSASTKYGDAFINESTVHWFTRSNRTLQSREVATIVNNDIPLHLFAKKDDAEGLDFYYLGEATSYDAVQTEMPNGEGKPLPVVTMNLHLQNPLDPTLYDYITAPNLT